MVAPTLFLPIHSVGADIIRPHHRTCYLLILTSYFLLLKFSGSSAGRAAAAAFTGVMGRDMQK